MTVTKVNSIVTELDLDVAFLLKPQNVYYLSRYHSVCSGLILLSNNFEPVYCTLWLDAPEARNADNCLKVATYLYPEQTLIGRLIQICRQRIDGNPARIGIEKDFMTVRQYDKLLQAFPDAEYINITPQIDRIRSVKSSEEISFIKKACEIADLGMATAIQTAKPGNTEVDVAGEAEYAMRKAGSPRDAFGTFVASGPRALLAHPHATTRRIKEGEPVVIDLGATWMGYCSDICRTVIAGIPAVEQIENYRLVLRAQQAGVDALKPGATAGSVFDAVQAVFALEGLSHDLPNDVGYGVGLRQSEFYPIIEKDSRIVIEEDMVIALIQTTAFNKSFGGLRVEDTFHVTPQGAVRMTQHPRETVM